MASLTKKPLKEVPIDDIGGGMNEAAPPTKVPIRECIAGENFRVSADGLSKEKRPGLTKLDSIYDFGTKKVFGAFGIEEEEGVDIAAFLEDEIKLKSGNDWNSIFSPTSPVDKPVSVVQDKGLVFVAGYEKLITLKDGQANYSGIEAPVSAPTVETITSPTDYKATEYPSSNQDRCGKLRSNAGQTLLSQSFKLEFDYELTRINLKLRKIGSPTGNIWAEIHQTRSGTLTTKNNSPGIVGQGTDNLDVSTLTGAFETKELVFSGTKPSLNKNNTYYLVIYGDFTVNAGNFVEVGFDCSSPDYQDGKYWEIDGSLSWKSYGTVDLIFELYGKKTEEGTLLKCGVVETGQYYGIREDPTDTELLAQEFKPDDNMEISSVKLAIKNQNLTAGGCWLEIHSSKDGTLMGKGQSPNIVGQASDSVPAGSIPSDYTWVEFTFSGTKPSLTADTLYYLVFYPSYSHYYNHHIRWTLNSSVLDNTDSWKVNDSLEWVKIGPNDFSFELIGKSTDEFKALEYSFENLDDIKELREANGTTLLAQEFQVFEASDVTKVKVFASKVGSLIGKFIWAEIHSAQGGISLTKNLSDNIVGEASDNVDADSLSVFPEYGWVTFTFSGVKPDLEANEIYYIVIYGDFTISTDNYVRLGMDKIDPQYSLGKRWDIDNSLDWTARESIDFIFELYMATSDLAGDYSFVITFIRGGNYQCESNPSPPSEKITITAGKIFRLTNIPVSDDPEVTHKGIYRTKAGGEKRYWEATIENNVTQFDTGVTDDGLGDEVSYDNNPPPAGDCVEMWDDRLWVSGVPGYMEGIFRSRLDYPEQFPATGISYMPLKEGESDPVIVHKVFKNTLYGLKSNSIFGLYKSGESYGITKVISGKGIGAKASLAETDDFLIFLSNKLKIEQFDGFRFVTPVVTKKVKKTLKSINKNYAYRATGGINPDDGTYRLAIPTGSSIVPNKVIVYDFERGNLFVDTYHQNICSVVQTDIAKSERVMLYGTSQGQLYKVDPEAPTDDGQVINMFFRMGWINDASWLLLRKILLDFILPANKILVFKVYSNFRESPDLSINLAGSTPTGSDAELRNIIHQVIKSSINGSYYSFEFINADNIGSELKIIKPWLYIKKKPGKRTIKAS